MKIIRFTYLLIILIIITFLTSSTLAQEKSTIAIDVDPRTELISIICRLAGYSEYNKGKVKSYSQNVENYFGHLRNHPAVQYASQLERTLGIGS